MASGSRSQRSNLGWSQFVRRTPPYHFLWMPTKQRYQPDEFECLAIGDSDELGAEFGFVVPDDGAGFGPAGGKGGATGGEANGNGQQY